MGINSKQTKKEIKKKCTRKNKCKKAKWLFEVALQITDKRREAKGKGEKERHINLNAASRE